MYKNDTFSKILQKLLQLYEFSKFGVPLQTRFRTNSETFKNEVSDGPRPSHTPGTPGYIIIHWSNVIFNEFIIKLTKYSIFREKITPINNLQSQIMNLKHLFKGARFDYTFFRAGAPHFWTPKASIFVGNSGKCHAESEKIRIEMEEVKLYFFRLHRGTIKQRTQNDKQYLVGNSPFARAAKLFMKKSGFWKNRTLLIANANL